MKSFLGFLFALAINVGSLAQTFTFNQGGTLDNRYYTELAYETANSKIFVYVEIAGKRRKFLFDTGSPSAITKELAAELKLQVVNKKLFTDALGNQDSVVIVSIDSIKLGKVTFDDIPAATVIPDFLKCWNIEGIVGSNILRNSIVKIDPGKHRIVITDQEDALSLKNKIGIPLTENIYAQSFPTFKVMIKDKINIEFGFDTGDPGFLLLSEDDMNQLSPFDVFEILSKGYGANKLGGLGVQKNDDTYRLKFGFLKIGEAKFDNVITETAKHGISRIGAKLLDYGNLTLDFIHRKLYFEAGRPETDLNDTQWPFRPVIRDHKLLVGTVWGNLKDQLRPGQQIMAINESAYDQVELCDWIHHKSVFDISAKMTLKIKDDDGQIKMIQIRKE